MPSYRYSHKGCQNNCTCGSAGPQSSVRNSCCAPQPSHKESCHVPEQEHPLAMAYVRIQEFGSTFPLCKSLQVGTIFPDLCKPFCGKRGVCK